MVHNSSKISIRTTTVVKNNNKFIVISQTRKNIVSKYAKYNN